MKSILLICKIVLLNVQGAVNVVFTILVTRTWRKSYLGKLQSTDFNRVLMHKAISGKLCNLIFSKKHFNFFYSAAEKLAGIQHMTLLNF
jgi:hypothetical protein